MVTYNWPNGVQRYEKIPYVGRKRQVFYASGPETCVGSVFWRVRRWHFRALIKCKAKCLVCLLSELSPASENCAKIIAPYPLQGFQNFSVFRNTQGMNVLNFGFFDETGKKSQFRVEKGHFWHFLGTILAWKMTNQSVLRWQIPCAALPNTLCRVGKPPLSRCLSRHFLLKTVPRDVGNRSVKKKAKRANA